MSGVMQSKLVHAQALLDGLVVSDYTKIEGNALALKRISEGGEYDEHFYVDDDADN